MFFFANRDIPNKLQLEKKNNHKKNLKRKIMKRKRTFTPYNIFAVVIVYCNVGTNIRANKISTEVHSGNR